MEKEFGQYHNSYNCVISALMVGNYGLSFVDIATNKADIFSVYSTDDFSLSVPVIFPEYSHPFINPLIEKYSDVVKQYENAYEKLAQYKLPGFKSGYGDWNECVNEHLARAMVIHLLRKNNLLDFAEEMFNNDLLLGYKYIPQILEQYKRYDENRNIYHSFEMFYHTLLEVFE